MIRQGVNTQQYYCVQFIGNKDSMKRMVASIYLVGSNKQHQTLKVCICDDLPHVVHAVNHIHKPQPNHEELESGLTLQVAHDRGLQIQVTVAAGEDSEQCAVEPSKVLIPSEAIWEPNAAFATDFNIEMARMSVEQCKLNVQITAQDEEGGDTPLNISQHVHVKWQPNYKAGVASMRKKWEESNKLYGSSTLPRGFKSANQSAPKFKQPGYQDLDRLLSGGFGGAKTSRVSMKNWDNVVTSPTSPRNRDHVVNGSVDSGRSEEGSERRMGGTLPAWARNGAVVDDDLNYDDVVVV